MKRKNKIKSTINNLDNNVWKLHRLLESVILERELQFVVELIRRLNGMFVIC